MTIGNTLKNTGIAAGVALVINLALFFIAKSMGWISDDYIVADQGPVSPIAVIFSTVVSSLIGGILYWILSNYVPYGVIIFWIIAIVVLFWSYFNPAKAIANVPDSMALILNVMHNVVASSLLYFLTGRRDNAFAAEAEVAA
jgi:hypothetical protein